MSRHHHPWVQCAHALRIRLNQRYFAHHSAPDAVLALGVGDDCALLNPTPGMQIAISSDMLVSGRHFFPDADPFLLGHKCLAVNLSDLAAMGAKPLGFTLAFLPEAIRPGWNNLRVAC
jgi:thiamine-monophosphate kinase